MDANLFVWRDAARMDGATGVELLRIIDRRALDDDGLGNDMIVANKLSTLGRFTYADTKCGGIGRHMVDCITKKGMFSELPPVASRSRSFPTFIGAPPFRQ